MATDTTCPVCGLEDAFSEPEAWEICSRCNWEDDPVQRADPDYWGGANTLSLNQSRQAWHADLEVFVMNWDVHLMSNRDYARSELGPRERVLRMLSESVPDMDLSDLAWGKLRRGRLFMEFAIGADAYVKSLWVYAYGSGDAVAVLKEICDRTGWVALDTRNTRGGNNTAFLDLAEQAKRTWQEWQRFRNRIYSERLQEASRKGKRLIFTTITEIQTSKPIEEFEEIRPLNVH